MKRPPIEVLTALAKAGIRLWGLTFAAPDSVVRVYDLWVAQGMPKDRDVTEKNGEIRFHSRNPPPPPFHTGDRIRCTQMTNDPDPIPVGTCGKVTGIQFLELVPCSWQVDVAWENGRTLSLLWPHDQAESVV